MMGTHIKLILFLIVKILKISVQQVSDSVRKFLKVVEIVLMKTQKTKHKNNRTPIFLFLIKAQRIFGMGGKSRKKKYIVLKQRIFYFILFYLQFVDFIHRLFFLGGFDSIRDDFPRVLFFLNQF